MQILILHRNETVRRRLAQVVSSLGHVPNVLADPSRLRARLKADATPDVALVSACHARFPEIVEALREQARHVYIIGLVPELGAHPVGVAYKLGCDDVMKRTASAEEIAGRVEALLRIRQWVGTMGTDFTEPGGEFDLKRLEAWNAISTVLADELAQMMGCTLHPSSVTKPPPLACAAEVTVTLPEASIEATIGVGLEGASTDAFATTVFGEPVAPDVLSDAVREFANSAGGAFKRSALVEGYTFSLGLPADASHFTPPANAAVWRLSATHLNLYVWTIGQSSPPQRISIASIREGMVVAHDVRNGRGTLLVAAGTVLTERTVARLRSIVGPAALLDVVMAA